MKVIDILVKLANKEEVPKTISINDYKVYDEYTIWTFENGCYGRNIKENQRQFLFEYLTTDMLNDEIEIIEDTPKENKKIEKFYFSVYQDQKLGGREVVEPLETKINELIDKINGE